MLLAGLLAVFALVAPPQAPAPHAPDTVRIEVLSLLVPQRVVVASPDATLELPGGGRLAPGGDLVVEREGRSIVARSGGWRWRGERLQIGERGRRLALDVRGRDQRERTVRGRLSIASDGRMLTLVVEAGLEDQVASAVAAELDNVTEPAALEAAAVVLRSYMIANAGRHASEGFDFCDTTHCLFSQGVPGSRSSAAVAAAAVTHGVVLERAGKVVVGYMTACCGGRTTTPSEVWGVADSDDFVGVACTFCSASPYFRWQRSSSVGRVAAVVGDLVGHKVGPDTDLVAVAGPGGWTRTVVVRADGRETRVGGDAFRMAVERRLGWDAIPSPRFKIERARGAYRFTGGGYGHGIGLCVAGAVERARRGATSAEILAAYFPSARAMLLETTP